MTAVGYVYDPVYLEHDTGQHPENATRLEAVVAYLEETGLSRRLVPLAPREATVEELALVHDGQYIDLIREVARQGGGWLDPDTVTSPRSYQAAVYAAGGAIAATEAVMGGEVTSSFALVRPPGHHATPRMARGFCLFNNLAVAARYALDKYHLERIAIIDFDVHHGNGTQEAFYDDPRVLYVSTHQYPFFPGTGNFDETGGPGAEGTKVNVPMPAGCGDGEYRRVFEQIVVPVVRRFQPGLIFVSAGYDSHWADGLAMMRGSITGITRLMETILGLADEFCRGRLVLCLEGGYNLSVLAGSVAATFEVLLGNGFDDPIGPPSPGRAPDIDGVMAEVKRRHRLE